MAVASTAAAASETADEDYCSRHYEIHHFVTVEPVAPADCTVA